MGRMQRGRVWIGTSGWNYPHWRRVFYPPGLPQRLELQYALAVRRPLLPVQIGDVAISTAPQAVADTQIVDYRQRTPEAGFALAAAVGHRPPAPPLPEPLPAEPAPPMSYMHEFSEQVDGHLGRRGAAPRDRAAADPGVAGSS